MSPRMKPCAEVGFRGVIDSQAAQSLFPLGAGLLSQRAN